MTRSPWPKDDAPRKKGQRRVRLWFVVNKSRLLAVRLTQGSAELVLRDFGPYARIRRAVASVRWVEP